MAKGKGAGFLQFVVTFALLYVGMQLALQMFFPQYFGPESQMTGIHVKMQDATIKSGHHPVLTVSNKSDQNVVLEDRCPMPPVTVSMVDGSNLQPRTTEETTLPCTPLTVLPAGSTTTVDLAPWKYSLFSEFGEYQLQLPIASGSVVGTTEESVTVRFTLSEAGPITKLFRTFVTKPLLNLLILIAKYLPGHNLGFAIILLTLLVKIALFFPTQHAMEGQKKLQQVQPQLDAIRKKYKDNPEKMNKEIMALWKKEGVNPMQSCLPTLIQFPVLIGLFFVIRDGSHLELSQHLIYPTFENLSWSWGMNFFGLDLAQPSKYIFPPLLVVLQFLQMKLTFAIANKKKEQAGKQSDGPDAQRIQQRMMQYGLPVLIGVFAYRFPAAVSLYWAISTVFAIGQQVVVNRKK